MSTPAMTNSMNAKRITIKVDDLRTVSGLILSPDRPYACYVLAHGAGAGMTHPFMTSVADGLRQRGMATLRYQFPYMESGSKRPDRPPLAHATVRAAVAAAAKLLPGCPLIAGGKSFGARMTSQAQSLSPLPNILGLAFLGFPLHPAGKLSNERAKHLSDVSVPMFFVQGTRDALADSRILSQVLRNLSAIATSHIIEHADHSFHVPARSGMTDTQVFDDLIDGLVRWTKSITERKQ